MTDTVEKMDTELKAKWLTALRSGDYAQGRYQLRTCDNEYCCLGVLCEIAGLNKSEVEDGYRYGKDDDNTSFAMLPYGFRPFSEKYESDLITKNDNGESFNTIADYIEENL